MSRIFVAKHIILDGPIYEQTIICRSCGKEKKKRMKKYIE